MKIAPNSTITFYSGVKIDSGDKETLIWSNASARDAYFASKAVATIPNCTMVKGRSNNVVKVSIPGTTLKTCNYMSFLNPSFDNQITYCKVIDYDYTNNEVAHVRFQYDPWITKMFEINMDACFIDREGLSEDEYTKALANPYNPDLIKMRTSESLPVGPDTEKTFYDVKDEFVSGDDFKNADGYKVFLQANSGYVNERMYTLLYLSPIDVSAFDDPDDPSAENALAEWFTYFHGALDTWTAPAFYRIDGDVFRKSSGASHYTGDLKMYNKMNTGYDVYLLPPSSTAPGTLLFHDIRNNPCSTPIRALINTLTVVGATSAIVNVYSIPGYLIESVFSNKSSIDGIHVSTPNDVGSTTVDPKLNLFPFSYIRMQNDSDIKEYKYDDFLTMQDGSGDADFATMVDIVEGVEMVVAPMYYKSKGTANKPNIGQVENAVNQYEAMRYRNIPTTPYVIDAWLAQCSANAQNNIAQTHTIDYGYNIQQQQIEANLRNDQIARKMAGITAKAFTGPFSALLGVPKDTNQVTSLSLANQQMENRFAMDDSAKGALLGEAEGNALYENFKYQRPLNAVNQYNGTNGDGVSAFTHIGCLDFTLYRVQRSDKFKEMYTKYFALYGYSYGGFNVPLIFNHLKNTSDNTKKVHWNTVDGSQVTYIKTSNAHVTGNVTKEEASYIESIFNNGCRFVKG